MNFLSSQKVDINEILNSTPKLPLLGQPFMTASRQFAIEVVQKLQGAQFTALWAGGCVRDQLAGKTPKDYDVATNATPDQVRALFGKKRTLAIGASFGVITVLGPKPADPIEVATFRRDSGYSDGRRPDSVEFTDAREDAIRRDFTINGMFYDPIQEKVIDYVGGQDDLKRKVIRAIGNPHERIEEDKLRMLRAVRFASTFEFELELQTMAAVRQHASEIHVVSGERIGAELRRMLKSPNRAVAVRMLNDCNLMPQILPGAEALDQDAWARTLVALEALDSTSFASSVAVLVAPMKLQGIAQQLFVAWKLSNDEKKTIQWILHHQSTLANADQLPWSQVQPLLIQTPAREALATLTALSGEVTPGVQFCLDRLGWPAEQLDPKPWLDGNDLAKLGIPAGPSFGKILKRIRVEQLDGGITSREQAAEFAVQLNRG